MPLSPPQKRVTSSLATDTDAKTFWILTTALGWLEASPCSLAGHLRDHSKSIAPSFREGCQSWADKVEAGAFCRRSLGLLGSGEHRWLPRIQDVCGP